MSSSRHIINSFPNYLPGTGFLKDRKPNASATLKIKSWIDEKVGILIKSLNGHVHDYSIYTGETGLALLFIRLADTIYKGTERQQELLETAKAICMESLEHIRGKRITFLCGDAGPLALVAVLSHREGNRKQFDTCMEQLLQLVQICCKDRSIPNEMLYGRAGLLYALLFVRKHCGNDSISNSILSQVCRSIIEAGHKLATSDRSTIPLKYKWHDKEYIGAAHGYLGIFFLLLHPDLIKLEVIQNSLAVIQECIDVLLSMRFESGNFPSSVGNNSDRLVQWCHGSPGAVNTLVRAHQVYGDAKYLAAAKKCCEVIWDRGLLSKGYGICHGAAGNAYAFLTLFNATTDEKYLYQAVKEKIPMMALEQDLAELNSMLDDLNNMMKDINVQSVLEFFPSNNNEAFKDIIQSEMDADGPAGRLLRTLSKDGEKKPRIHVNSNNSSKNNVSLSSPMETSYPAENGVETNSDQYKANSVSSSSVSYDENIVDLASCSECSSHTRPNSILKVKDDFSSESSAEYDTSSKEDIYQGNGAIKSKKLHVTVYFQERPIDLEIPQCATARDVAHRIIIINRLQASHAWTIFECLKDYDLERNLEDHELIKDVLDQWQTGSNHHFQMRNFTKKYEFFDKPSIYLPSYLMLNDETKTATLRADEAWSPEYASFLTTDDRVPPLENFLHIKDYRKKSWNRKYCLLRATGIFSSSKSGFKRSSREVKCNVEFSNNKLFFTSSTFKGSHSAPYASCFCFVPDAVTNQKGIKCFCAENEQVMQSWIMGYRLAKYGSKLYRNYKIATQDNRAAKTVSAPVDMEAVVRRKRPSIDYRVPIDFSGNESRVVSDPQAARAVIDSISSKLPKRLKRRSTGSYHSPYASGIPAVLEKAWFHGKLEREQAVKLLRSGGMEEGLFLVRESCTSAGVYVISVVKKKKILHHQIFKAVGESQVFYGLEQGPGFQTLEQLIEFYQSYRHAGKAPLLKKPCKRVDKSF